MIHHWLPVCVRCHGPDESGKKTEAGYSTFTASGIALDSNLVVTSASLLQPFLVDKLSSYGEFALGPQAGVDILFEKDINDEGEEVWTPAELIAVVEAEGMLSSVKRLTGQDAHVWRFGWGAGHHTQSGTDLGGPGQRFSLRNMSISGIAILRLGSPSSSASSARNSTNSTNTNNSNISSSIFSDALSRPISMPAIGKHLTLHGSGFGLIAPSVLMNNISQGVVANIVHPYRVARRAYQNAQSLIMTDAKYLPGMEGGPVSWDETGELAGMSMLPIRRSDGEPVDITLVIPVACIISAIAPYVGAPKELMLPEHFAALSTNNLMRARESVVMVQVGQTWASGVVISKDGHILTNAHVFASFLDNVSNRTWPTLRSGVSLRVRIDNPQQQQWVDDCEVVFVSDSCWDVAVIKIPETCILHGFLPYLPLRTRQELNKSKPVVQGTPVFAIGHGIFGPSSGVLPLITSGSCSKVVSSHGQPVMLLSSAPVHRGNSGGVLVDTLGQLVGLVTGNGKTSTGRTITHLNFAIPIEAITDQLNAFLVEEDVKWLDPLNAPSQRIDDIWSLRGTAPVWEPLERAKL
ncbi:hypothetical protein BGZ73_007187 [Actinomortierella ambigua]|nr:hypothetical protein BGZ73_007187 [Actinomortierella ambigua]